MITPQKSFPAGTETGEIAAAKLATVRSGAQAQLETGGEIGIIVLFRPRTQFHAVTLRAARVDNLGRMHNGTLKPGLAPFAAQLENAEQLQQTLSDPMSVGCADIARPAGRAHSVFTHGNPLL